MNTIVNLPSKIICSSLVLIFSAICYIPLHPNEKMSMTIVSFLFMINIITSFYWYNSLIDSDTYIKEKEIDLLKIKICKIHLLTLLPLFSFGFALYIFLSVTHNKIAYFTFSNFLKLCSYAFVLINPIMLISLGCYYMKNNEQEENINSDHSQRFMDTKIWGFFVFLYGLQLLSFLAISFPLLIRD